MEANLTQMPGPHVKRHHVHYYWCTQINAHCGDVGAIWFWVAIVAVDKSSIAFWELQNQLFPKKWGKNIGKHSFASRPRPPGSTLCIALNSIQYKIPPTEVKPFPQNQELVHFLPIAKVRLADHNHLKHHRQIFSWDPHKLPYSKMSPHILQRFLNIVLRILLGCFLGTRASLTNYEGKISTLLVVIKHLEDIDIQIVYFIDC